VVVKLARTVEAQAAAAAAASISMLGVLAGGARRPSGRGGNKAMCLCRLGSGRTRGTLGRTRELSEPMHFGPKADAKMGARGHVRIVLSVWVEPLGRLLCPRGLVRMRSIHLGWPTGDALNFRVPGLLGEGQEVCEDQQDV
jgi:hypothetical protein